MEAQAFSEIYDIINHFELDMYNKIPKKFITMLENHKDNNHIVNIDYSKKINDQNILRETKIILSLIYRDFICSPKEKQELNSKDIIELNKKVEVTTNEFNYNELFKKERKYVNNNLEKEVVVYKKSIFKRIISFLKNIIKY